MDHEPRSCSSLVELCSHMLERELTAERGEAKSGEQRAAAGPLLVHFCCGLRRAE
jgi:hypothetical protein